MPDVARTLDLPSGQRFEYWKHVLSHTFVALEVCCPGEDGDFRGRLRGCELGSLRFIEVLADAHTARRTPRLVKAAPAGCYKIGLQLRGSSVLIQDGREATLTPGDFTLYDTDRPYTLAFGDPHRMLVLVFPRDMLGLPQSRLAQLTATRLPGEAGGLATLIGPFLGQVADLLDDADTPAPQVGLRLAGNVLDLLGTVLTERLDCAPPDPDTAHRALMLRITAFIEEHLGEADLAPSQIAAAHHISLRQLHKLFHASGTTVAGWIRERRLEHCGHDLRDPRWVARPVAAIGARWGYPDPAHFSRLFKASYGMGPRDYRTRQGHLFPERGVVSAVRSLVPMPVLEKRTRTLRVKRRALGCKTRGGRRREHGGMDPRGLLRGRAAIITGGEGSIGMATARAFVAEGARVCLVGLLADELRDGAAALGGGAIWASADVTSSEQVKTAVAAAAAAFGRLDVVVSNAGIAGVIAPVADYPEDVFDQVLAVHVRGSFLVCKHSLPYLGAGGSIVITSSVVGLTSDPGICAYATAKHALVGLMRTLAKESAPRGIRVNTIHPGPVDNDFQHRIEVAATGADRERATAIFDGYIPLARHATPDEVARTMLFLASDQSSFVTGATLAVDGGMSI